MNAESDANFSGANGIPKLNSAIRHTIIVLAALAAVGGVMRAAGLGNWDWQTLLFFFGAAVILLLPWAVRIKFGKDGVEIEMPSSVKELGVGGKKKSATARRTAQNKTQPSATSLLKDLSIRNPPQFLKQPEASVATELTAGVAEMVGSGGGEYNEDDPQKGQWGGSEVSNGRRINATVRPIPNTPEWFAVRLVVSSMDTDKPLAGVVTFHLHPTFKKDTEMVVVKDGRAELELAAWDAFTVGAECDDGETRLELDLATLPDVPADFRA